MLLPLLYPSQRYPLFLFVYILLLFVSQSVFFCCCFFSTLYQLGAHTARCSFAFYYFGFTPISGHLWTSAEQPPPLYPPTSHLRESLPGKDHFTSLISFRGWFTGVNTHLSLIIRASHRMVWSGMAGFRPSRHISHSVGNLGD